MVVEYVAASALAELRSLATPASLQTVTLSRGVEEDASFAGLAAVQALAARPFYRTILAAELLTALRAVRQRELAPPGLAGLLTTCARLPTEMSDRDLTADIAIAESVARRAAAGLDHVVEWAQLVRVRHRRAAQDAGRAPRCTGPSATAAASRRGSMTLPASRPVNRWMWSGPKQNACPPDISLTEVVAAEAQVVLGDGPRPPRRRRTRCRGRASRCRSPRPSRAPRALDLCSARQLLETLAETCCAFLRSAKTLL